MSLIYILEDDKNIQEIESYAIKGNGCHAARGGRTVRTEKAPLK